MLHYQSDETTSKLILLYVLEKIECELTEENIADMCYFKNKWLTYFTCTIALEELVKAGYVSQRKSSTKTNYYSITTNGHSCLSCFYSNIPESIRESISEYVKENNLDIKRKQEYYSDCFRNDDSSYTVVLKIIDFDTVKLELKIIAESQEKAKDIQKLWQTNASKIYVSVFDNLLS